MIEFPDVGDLRPAPRTTPTAVLWLMSVVVVGCAGLLAGPSHDDAAWPGASAASPQGRRAAAIVAATRADIPASAAIIARTAGR
jgi:hypothetical protein